MKTIRKTARSLCSVATAVVFFTFLAASAPHRVHHLLENVPAPKPERAGPRVLSISSAPRPQRVTVEAAPQSRPAAHGPSSHDHPSHSNHHGKKAGHRHNHSQSHAHSRAHSRDTHRHEPAPAPEARTSSTASSSAAPAEPLHANAPKRDAHHDNSARSDCIVQAAAQQAQLAPADSAPVDFPGKHSDLRCAVQFVAFSAFDPAPFSQRAPPSA